MASLECAQFISKEVSASCSFFSFPSFFQLPTLFFHISASVTPKMKALIAPARAWVELQRTNGGEHSVIKAQKGFFSPENFRRLPGSQLNREWVGEHGFTEPILLNTIEGSGLWFNHGLLDINHIVDVLGRPPLSFNMQRKRQNHPSSMRKMPHCFCFLRKGWPQTHEVTKINRNVIIMVFPNQKNSYLLRWKGDQHSPRKKIEKNFDQIFFFFPI